MTLVGADAVQSTLGALLGGSSEALPFARYVVTELTGLGPLGPPDPANLRRAAIRVAELLEACTRAGGDEVARALLAEPAFAAAFFQNLDLLYEHAYPRADEVSRVIMRAMEIAIDAEAGQGSAPLEP